MYHLHLSGPVATASDLPIFPKPRSGFQDVADTNHIHLLHLYQHYDLPGAQPLPGRPRPPFLRGKKAGPPQKKLIQSCWTDCSIGDREKYWCIHTRHWRFVDDTTMISKSFGNHQLFAGKPWENYRFCEPTLTSKKEIAVLAPPVCGNFRVYLAPHACHSIVLEFKIIETIWSCWFFKFFWAECCDKHMNECKTGWRVG